MEMNQLLNLLLLLVVMFVINLPSCWSLCDITEARRLACARKYQDMHGPWWKESDGVAKRAADQAGVVYEAVLETYRVTRTVLERFYHING